MSIKLRALHALVAVVGIHNQQDLVGSGRIVVFVHTTTMAFLPFFQVSEFLMLSQSAAQ